MAGSYTPAANGTVSGAAWMREKWAAELDMLAYEVPVLWSRVRDFGPPGSVIHIPKFDNLSRTIISEALTGATGLTFIGNTETAFTATAGTSVVPVEVSKALGVRMALDPKNEIRRAVDLMIQQAIDSDLLSLATGVTTNVVGDPGTNVSKGDILDAYQKVTGAAKMYAEPGEGGIFCVLANTQIDDFLAISDLTSALVRGGSETPTVTGWIKSAFGVNFGESTSVSTSGGYAANLMLVPRAFGIGFNMKPDIIAESYQIWDRIMAWADYAYGRIREQYACLLKTSAT